MQILKKVDPATATGKTKEIFDAIVQKTKFVPNMFQVMGNSPTILKLFSDLNFGLDQVKVGQKIRVLMTARVSQITGDDYILSFCSAIKQKLGISDEEFNQARQGMSDDPKAKAALVFAGDLVNKQGQMSLEDVEMVRRQGFTDEEVVEMIGITCLAIYWNYFNLAAGTEIEFPLVKA